MNAARLPRLPFASPVAAVALLWIMRTLASLLVACPVIFTITGTALVSGPERDAPLFQSGAMALLELVRVDAASLGSALKVSLVLAAACAVLGLVPLGAVLDLLQRQQADAFGSRFARGIRLFPSFLALSGITLLAQAALLLGASLLGSAARAGLQGQDERVLTLLPMAVFALGLLGCAWLGAIQDVARSVATQRAIDARPALFEALSILRAEPSAVLLGSYPSVAGSAFAWLGGAWLVSKIDLASPTARGIVLAFAVHQLAILLSIALRVRWLNGALALASDTRAQRPSARD